jgi:hypothetical protein
MSNGNTKIIIASYVLKVIIIIAIPVFFFMYYGGFFLEPSPPLPDKCVFGAAFGCSDFAAFVGSPGSVKAELINGFGYTILIQDVRIDITGMKNPPQYQCSRENDLCNLTRAGVEWKADEKRELYFPMDLKSSDRPRIEVSINYSKKTSNTTSIVRGTIQPRPI